jgi:hypothetical protein
MSIGSFLLSPATALIGIVVLGILVIGLFRFLLRLAWKLIGILLTLAIVAGVVLFFLNAIHIQW